MDARGKLISRIGVAALVACLAAGASTLSAEAAPGHPPAGAAKKCKRTHHGKKHRCKRRAPAPAAIAISPMSQDFGVPQVGGEDRTFTVTNVGGSPSGVPISALTPPGTDFSIAANDCMAPLSAAASCSIVVHVATNGAGHVSALLTVSAIPGGLVSAPVTADIEA
jgi:hypothetical protein